MLQLQKLPGMEDGKKCLGFGFRLTEDREFVGKNVVLGASYSTSNKLLFVARHILTRDHQKCL